MLTEQQIEEMMARVRRLELKARRLVRESFSGEYLSSFRGQGLDFDDFREYQHGDEVRFIDWNVTARMNQPFVRKFREERELSVVLAVDVSGSTIYGSESMSKREIAAEAAVGVRPGMQIHGTDYPTRDGTCVRDYVHVTDLAHAHVNAVEHLLGGGQSLVANVGYGHGYSVRAVIAEALRLADRPFAVAEGPRRAGDPVSVVANPARAMETLGWQPRHDNLEAMILSGMAWERQRASVEAGKA